jgi:hypothetical protein
MAFFATERLAAFVRDHPLLALSVACLCKRLDLDLDMDVLLVLKEAAVSTDPAIAAARSR